MNKWLKFILIPLLCISLAAVTGCGKGKTQSPQETAQEAEVSADAEETPQDTEEENSASEEEGDSGGEDTGSGYDSGEGEDSYSEDQEGSGEDTYSEAGDAGEDSWNEYEEAAETSGGDQEGGDGEEYTAEEGDSDGSGYQEDDSSGQEEGSSEEKSYEEQYSGSGGQIDENGIYTTAEDVALYIHTYGRLPGNFMTKKEARNKGWSGGSLEKYAPGMCIGGDRFGNYEKVLPEGRYRECDINTLGKKKRGAERLIYSDDGRIYYTSDHYETFTLLYGSE
ncbi:MAG: hypothetical protein E7238_01355 [Sarcina sp.]|nr:hypothetical protein [Sarcina sp.]